MEACLTYFLADVLDVSCTNSSVTK